MVRRTRSYRARLLVGLFAAVSALTGLAPAGAQSPYRGDEPPERVETVFFEQPTMPPEPGPSTGLGGILPFTGGELWMLVALGVVCIVIGVLLHPRRGDAHDVET